MQPRYAGLAVVVALWLAFAYMLALLALERVGVEARLLRQGLRWRLAQWLYGQRQRAGAIAPRLRAAGRCWPLRPGQPVIPYNLPVKERDYALWRHKRVVADMVAALSECDKGRAHDN